MAPGCQNPAPNSGSSGLRHLDGNDVEPGDVAEVVGIAGVQRQIVRDGNGGDQCTEAR
jgi:hypothetical protein